MTTKEQIEQLNKNFAAEQAIFAAKHAELVAQVAALGEKLSKTKEPANLERDILQTAQNSISKAVETVLVGYDSPLTKLVKIVVEQNSSELRQIISDSFSSVIKKEEFKKSILDAFSHKVARTIISNNEGLFDKVSNELKQDSVFKAKMSIAVANVVEECLNQKRENKVN